MDDDWQLRRVMTPTQFRRIVKQLAISKAAAGRYIGISPRRVWRILNGKSKMPVSASLLLHSLVAHNERPVVPRWSKD